MMLSVSILTYFISMSQSLTINCTGEKVCYQNTTNCTNNENCAIICNGAKSCQHATFKCPNSIKTDVPNECNIECHGYWSCRSIEIIGGLYSELNINASGDNVLTSSSIEARESSKLTLIGNGVEAFYYGKIICPDYTATNVCNVIYNGNQGSGFKNTWIFSNASFMGVNMICSNYSPSNCWGTDMPKMYCVNPWIDPYSDPRCNAGSSDGYNWNCQDPNSECYMHPTMAPSFAPTANSNEKDILIIIVSIALILMVMMIIFVWYR
eukprot:317975_1